MSTINGKPVLEHNVAKVINLRSGFKDKLLCDGPTFSLGTACVYSCSFCYVPDLMHRLPIVHEAKTTFGKGYHDIVVRRTNALNILEGQLVETNGKPRHKNPTDKRVIYASPLVDVAANIELAKETVHACLLILKHTNWEIRLLSKSNLLPYIASHIPDKYALRMIYGVSTGTLNDQLAKAFEAGTPLVSKRIASLHKLQDMGLRTYGMICPSLPQNDYSVFSNEIVTALRPEKCEHIWAEVINVRGDSMIRTCNALSAAGFSAFANSIKRVSESPSEWEAYSRETFIAHTKYITPDKLRFLQYTNPSNLLWWKEREHLGAVLLGTPSTSV